METKIVLVTGGARSGKSVFAERLLASCGGVKAYVATAQILDEEMANRVVWHRKRRPDAWHTFEVPHDLPAAIHDILKRSDAVLVDCLTLYFSNFLLRHSDLDFNMLLELAVKEINSIIQHIRSVPNKKVIFVTNELGSGIVPAERLTRDYRDLMGFVNQRMGQEAEQVYLAVCGITTEIKSRQAVLLPLEEKEV